MTAELATALLNRAANGAELLQVLDSLAADSAQDPEPTAEEIQF
jgi:hypothetical protein